MSKGRAAQLVEAGLWLRLSGDHEGARRLFEQALKLDPENARAKQLLDAPPAATGATTDAFKPPSSGEMDLDWGSATGFESPDAKPPPPVDVAPVAMVTTPESLPPPVFDLPVEGDVTIGPEPGHPSYGPPEAPTAPEPWTDHVPTVQSAPRAVPRPVPPTVSPFTPPDEHQPPTNTMVFAGTNPAPASGAPPSNTMVFAGTSGSPPPQISPLSSGTLDFSHPGQPLVSSSTLVMMPPGRVASPVAPEGSGTMVFSQPVAPPMMGPSASPPKSNTMVYSQPVAPPLSAMPAQPAAPAVQPVSDRAAELFGGMEPESLLPLDVPPPPLPQPPGASPAALMKGAKSGWDRQSNPGIELREAAPELSNVLDLVKNIEPRASMPPTQSADQRKAEAAALLRGAKDLLDLDDHTGAMELIVKAQELAPDDGEVKAMRERSEKTLTAMFESKLGDLNHMPRVKLKDDEIIWLNLDHRAGFVLAQIDGTVSFEDIFAVSGMSRLDTGRILAQLIEEGVISR